MAKCGMLLLIHSEVFDPEVDFFDREKVFIDRELRPLLKAVPELKIVMEHITTEESVKFVMASGPNLAATITAHHLLYNRNAIFAKGLNPHFYCLPILKRERHRAALLRAAASGSPKFFAGTDSAPHVVGMKETSCGCAGCYSAHAALELYAEAFELSGARPTPHLHPSHRAPRWLVRGGRGGRGGGILTSRGACPRPWLAATCPA